MFGSEILRSGGFKAIDKNTTGGCLKINFETAFFIGYLAAGFLILFFDQFFWFDGGKKTFLSCHFLIFDFVIGL